MSENTVKTPSRLATVKELPTMAGYRWLSEIALRHLIFKALPRKNSKDEAIATNGLYEAGAIIKIGRKILIDLDQFDLWVGQHRQGKEVADV